MKEIIFVVVECGHGGAERVISELSNKMSDRGHRVTVVEIHPAYNGRYFLNNKVNNIRIEESCENKLVRHFRKFVKLLKIMRENSDATVIAFTPQCIALVAVATVFARNRIIFSERNDPCSYPETQIGKIVRNISFHAADACVFQTNEAKKYFSNKVKKKSIVIRNPVNSDLPEWDASYDSKTLTAFCRLTAQKNIPMMIDAFKYFDVNCPGYVLEIFGEGDKREELQQMILDSDLSEKVFLRGHTENVYEKLSKCSMYVSSSNYEGISNSMLEALAIGVPSVVTDCPAGGAKMMIENEVNGMLVPVDSAKDMANAMEKIAKDKKFAKEIGDNAKLVRQQCSINNICDEWLEIV